MLRVLCLVLFQVRWQQDRRLLILVAEFARFLRGDRDEGLCVAGTELGRIGSIRQLGLRAVRQVFNGALLQRAERVHCGLQILRFEGALNDGLRLGYRELHHRH